MMLMSFVATLECDKLNAVALPFSSNAVKKVLTMQPTSAVAEKGFLLLNSGLGDIGLQENSLKDYSYRDIIHNH